MMAYLWLGVEHGESMIICGGTASGKTSALNSIALFIPPGAKIVTMEDTREINLPHDNWIPGTTRTGVGEKDGRRQVCRRDRHVRSGASGVEAEAELHHRR